MRKTQKPHRAIFRIGLLFTSVEFGGLEQVVMGLLDHTNREKYCPVPIIFTACGRNDNTVVSHLEKTGNPYLQIIVNSNRVKYLNPFLNIKQAYRLVKTHRFDLIHSHGYRADVIGWVVARALNLPIIATCHGFITNDRKLTFYNTIDRFILRHFDRVIAVSSGIGRSLIDSGVKEKNICIIPNAVKATCDEKDLLELRSSKRDLMGLKERDFVCGYVGRLSKEKGLRYLIEAASGLLNYKITIKLAIIGEGIQREELELLSRQKGIDKSITFMGFQRDVQSWLPAFDLFVLPSLMEGTPMALLEAMLYGLPVVASNVGGIPDVIKSGENGILVSPGAPQEIGSAISLLFSSKELRSKIGEKGRETAQEKYSMKQWIQKIETEYFRVLGG
jgi:L-malate glycosyltransferase